MRHCSISDIGLVREKNQDAYLYLENQSGDVLAVVLDGIGGAKAGEVASSEAVAFLQEHFLLLKPYNDLKEAKESIYKLLNQANEHVYRLGRRYKDYEGMGTTLSGLFFTKFGVLSLNIGDSRVYGVLDNKLFHLTDDDTLVNEMLKNGEISYLESLNHPKRHYLTKAIGIYLNIDPDIHPVKNMERYLICSDGMYGYCQDEELLNILNDNTLSIDDCLKSLKNLALMKGGYDNITGIIIDLNE